MVLKFGRLAVLVLALAFVAPSFEAHACAPDCVAGVSIAGETAVQDASVAEEGKGCADCGPACSNGCCHAPHLAVAPDVAGPRPDPVFQRPSVWADVAGLPASRPSGPERPPRA